MQGKHIILRPAEPSDSRSIYEWLVASDLTQSMMGPPLFPEVELPSWEQFCSDYRHHFFDGSRSDSGRCYIIEVDNVAIGQLNYDGLDSTRRCAELDIWLRSSQYCSKGYGSDAINTLVAFLQSKYHVKEFVLRPSQRNPRAIRAYERASFTQVCMSKEEQTRIYGEGDYSDDVLMIRSGVA
jgi:RimJ/RimL family protein N-acetyltransferase